MREVLLRLTLVALGHFTVAVPLCSLRQVTVDIVLDPELDELMKETSPVNSPSCVY